MSPLIWRRFLVSSETSIAQFHEYIQIAFAWSGEHLHRFRIQGKDYGIAYRGSISFDDNPHRVPLSCFRLHLHEHFRYEYHFTAHWQVQIRLEEILPLDLHHSDQQIQQEQRCLCPHCEQQNIVKNGRDWRGA